MGYKIEDGMLVEIMQDREILKYCPFSDQEKLVRARCGVWCPHFKVSTQEFSYSGDNIRRTNVTLCHGTELSFETNLA